MLSEMKPVPLDDAAKALANDLGFEHNENSIMSYEEHQQKVIKEVQASLEVLVYDVVEGISAIYSVLDEAITKSDSSNVVIPTLEEIKERFIALSSPPPENEEATLQELLKISDDALAVMFVAAYLLQSDKRYKLASSAFQALTLFAPKIADSWIGLGMALEMQGKKEEALDAFRFAVTVEPSNAAGYQQAAILAYELNDLELAHEIIQSAKDWMIGSGLEADKLNTLASEIDRLDLLMKEL